MNEQKFAVIGSYGYTDRPNRRFVYCVTTDFALARNERDAGWARKMIVPFADGMVPSRWFSFETEPTERLVGADDILGMVGY